MTGRLTNRIARRVMRVTITRGSAPLRADSGNGCRASGPPRPAADNVVEEVAQIFLPHPAASRRSPSGLAYRIAALFSQRTHPAQCVGAATPGLGNDDPGPHPLGAWHLAGLPRGQRSSWAVTARCLRCVIDGRHPPVLDRRRRRRRRFPSTMPAPAVCSSHCLPIGSLIGGYANPFGGGGLNPQCAARGSRRSFLVLSFWPNRGSFGLVLP
jgi:hypothetical protein